MRLLTGAYFLFVFSEKHKYNKLMENSGQANIPGVQTDNNSTEINAADVTPGTELTVDLDENGEIVIR